ncbi:CatA-like O-acetyltransferase [Amphibacillus sp. Q70]
MQAHHAVCDGFHTGKFITSLQALADNYHDWLNE